MYKYTAYGNVPGVLMSAHSLLSLNGKGPGVEIQGRRYGIDFTASNPTSVDRSEEETESGEVCTF